MHSKHGALNSAVALFTQSNQRSVVSWNLLLRAYSRQGGHGHVVLDLFQQMQQEGVMPNRVTYVCILSALVNHPAQTVDGKHMHACIQASKFSSDVVVGTAIFNMYGRCGSLQSAWEVFDDMPMRDVVAWNAMIAVYAHHGLCKEALHMFGKMMEEGLLIPNKTTYVNVLAACANQAGLDHGRQMHNHIQDSMCDVDVMVATALVNMYGKCSSIEDAWRTFLRMPERNVITWNVMIFLFAQQSQSQKALELRYQMQNEGILPDSLTFVSLFAACTSEATLAEGERLLASILTSGLEMDVVLGNSIINMYGKCGSLERAQRALETMPEQNVITWTTIITAYTQNNHGKLALELYCLMQQAGIRPNQVTFISVLDACASHGKLVEGKLIHAYIMDDGYEGEIAVRNSLISMYGKCGSLPDAQAIFHKMIERDIVSWNTMIVAHSCQGEVTEAFQLFIQMQKILIMPNLFTFVSMLDVCSRVLALVEGKQIHAYVIDGGFESETILGTALINMYSKCGMLEDACKAFDMILEQNVVSWTALITAYAQLGQGKQAIELFDQMQEKGVKPNNVTFISILSAFSNTKALVEAEQMCNRILNCGLDSDIMVGNTLVTLYGKCGSIDCARMAFDKMHERDLISWNSMMAVYAQHGSLEEAFQLLEQMYWEGLTPDRVTFLTVIDACSKQLALDEGKRFHCCIAEMECKQDVILGTSVMSMYGKCGSVNDALKVFNSMPEHDVVSWTVIVAVCAQNGQAKEAIQLFHQMQQEGVTPNEVTFSNVINACSHAGLFHDGLACFTSMVETYSISPDVDHYVSMIDLLGRAGQIHQADNLISDMPFQPTTLPYMTLLGACRQPVGVLQGKQAAVQAMELDPDNPASYVMLSNIHATLGDGGR